MTEYAAALAKLLEGLELGHLLTIRQAAADLAVAVQDTILVTEAESLLATHLAQHLERETGLVQEQPAPQTFQATMLDTLPEIDGYGYKTVGICSYCLSQKVQDNLVSVSQNGYLACYCCGTDDHDRLAPSWIMRPNWREIVTKAVQE